MNATQTRSPSLLPVYTHEPNCRAWEYRDNDMCDCTPVEVHRFEVQWFDALNTLQEEHTFSRQEFLRLVNAIRGSGGTIRKVTRFPGSR